MAERVASESSTPGAPNLLCYGDNLGFLTDRTLFPDACVDLIYLDPPFNSQQNYNVLFKETAGTPETAQIKAFEDTWTWDMAANAALTQIHQDPSVPAPLVELTKTFMSFLKASPMMAYLVQMAIRLVHMHRVLKPTGSLYLHCDPTASHYLKIILDAVFGAANFANEIVWKRTSAHSSADRFGPVHDVILFYTKGDRHRWNDQFQPYAPEYIETFFEQVDDDKRRWKRMDLTGAGTRNGETGMAWHGIDITAKGRHWAYPPSELDKLDAAGRIHWPVKADGMPRLKQYLEDMKGVPLQDVWTDLPPIHNLAAERLGYPTQKPLALLKRIILASSNPGDTILDPFCGCGTTIDAVETINREARVPCLHAQRGSMSSEPSHDSGAAKEEQAQAGKPVLPRRWIGIDVTHLSINLIKHRLTRFVPPPVYEVIGEPASAGGAEALAQQDPYQFQFWALGLVGARPVGGSKKKGADRGIDGVRYFVDELKGGQQVMKRMLVQVKGGHVKPSDVRDLVGTVSREAAELAVLITLESPTGPMRSEAATAGMYTSPWDGKAYPRVQIVTIGELLKDPYRPNPRSLQVPGGTVGPSATLPEAPRHKRRSPSQGKLGFEGT